MRSQFLLAIVSVLMFSSGVLSSDNHKALKRQNFGGNRGGFGGNKGGFGGGRGGFGGNRGGQQGGNKGTGATTSAPPTTTTTNNNANNGGKGGTGNGGQGNTGGQGGANGLTLLSNLVQKASSLTGLEPGLNGSTTADIVASSTSPNNFINFCASSRLPVMNGTQFRGGACNGIPMGEIGNLDVAPQIKMAFPANLGTIPANTNFTALINIKSFNPGSFTNALATYYAAPCTVDGNGVANGHTHLVVQPVDSFTSTTPLVPSKFTFFLGLKGNLINGQLQAPVTGLPAGLYRFSTITTCNNHQALNGAVAQRGQFDDAIYVTVSANGGNGGNQGGNGGNKATTGTTTQGNGQQGQQQGQQQQGQQQQGQQQQGQRQQGQGNRGGNRGGKREYDERKSLLAQRKRSVEAMD